METSAGRVSLNNNPANPEIYFLYLSIDSRMMFYKLGGSMRILCVYELGSPIDSLDHLRQCAESMRRRHSDVEIYLALRGDTGGADTSWADKVLVTPIIKIKTSHSLHGYWKFLHETGWSDPQQRMIACTIWANLYRSVKPDYVFAAGSPSALLVASIENVKAIQIGNGRLIPSVDGWGDGCPFPELEAWMFLMTRHTVQKLLTHPSVVFSHRAIDEERLAPTFHVVDDLARPGGLSLDLDVLAVWNPRHRLTSVMRKYASETWGDRFHEVSLADLRIGGYDPRTLAKSRPLIIGNYDPMSVGMAIKHDLPYIGSPASKMQSLVSRRSEEKRITFRLDDDLMMLKSFADEPFVLQGHAAARDVREVKAVANIDSVLGLLAL
jgi:hypothetical protein